MGSIQRSWAPLVFSSLIAGLGWSALAIDFTGVLSRSLTERRDLVEAVFNYFRFFTILTNCGVAALMTGTAVSMFRDKPLLPPSFYRAALVYMVVTCLTYELLLRPLWSPRGLQFWTDLTFHDIHPALTLLFWVFCAPKRALRWHGLPWLLAYPAVYFTAVEVAGALGASYPYHFLDAAKLGLPVVLAIGAAFLAVFLALGSAVTAVARLLKDGPSAAV